LERVIEIYNPTLCTWHSLNVNNLKEALPSPNTIKHPSTTLVIPLNHYPYQIPYTPPRSCDSVTAAAPHRMHQGTATRKKSCGGLIGGISTTSTSLKTSTSEVNHPSFSLWFVPCGSLGCPPLKPGLNIPLPYLICLEDLRIC
jgi:hypothetical protein